MGRMYAEVFAEEVREGTITLDAAMEYHLLHNHFPPHPRALIPVAIAAIAAANSGEYDGFVTLPAGIQWKDRNDDQAPVVGVITSMHLESFLDAEDDNAE